VGGFAVLTLAIGVAVATGPTSTLAAMAAAAGGAVLLLCPLGYAGAFALAGLAIVPSLLVDPPETVSALGIGQARVLVVILGIVAIRAVAGRLSVTLPALCLAAAGLFALELLATAAVALTDATADGPVLSELSRELGYMGGLGIGLVAGSAAVAGGDRLTAHRAMACVAVLVYVASIAYWAWTAGVEFPSSLEKRFAGADALSDYPQSRSVFPFSDNSPNLSAVAYVVIAAFVASPLVTSGVRRDRVLGASVAAGCVLAVLTTQSRTGLVVLATAILVFAVLSSRVGSPGRLILTGALTAALLLVLSPSIFPPERELSFRTATFEARERIWEQAWGDVRNEPLIGHGYNFSVGERYGDVSAPGGAENVVLTSVHSEYLGQLVDGGVLGILLFGATACLFGLVAARLMRVPRARGVAIGYVACLAAAAVAMVDSSVTKSAVCVTLLWLFLGVASASLAEVPPDADPPEAEAT